MTLIHTDEGNWLAASRQEVYFIIVFFVLRKCQCKED